MHLYKSILSLSLAAALSAAPQALSAQTESKPSTEGGVEHLDTLVVSASLDAKSLFEMAQGASVLSGERLLLSKEATLGETLDGQPGISSSYHGPGSSRPLIRGMGGERVRMLQNGVGAFDLSSISPDHDVTLEPMLLERVEVLRGPATLLYGSSAVGGVVNAIDNRIPFVLPGSQPATRVELRGDTAQRERTGIVAAGAARSGWGVQANAYRTRSDDMHIPGYASTDPLSWPGSRRGRLENSFVDNTGVTAGLGFQNTTGMIGAAFGYLENNYGVPSDEQVHIAMRQKRVDLEARLAGEVGLLQQARLKYGYGDYTHSEIGPEHEHEHDHEEGEEEHEGHDPVEHAHEETEESVEEHVHTRFTNRSHELRLEAQHQPLGGWSGTLGFQLNRVDFSSEGEEVVAPENKTEGAALFLLEERRFGPLSLQLGGRMERQRIRLGQVPAGLPVVEGYSAISGQSETSTGGSLGAGLVYQPLANTSIALSLTRSERLPTAQERFSNGPHGGTASYEVGRSDLPKERSTGVELSLRRRADWVTGSLGLFMNRFDGYIFEQWLPDGTIPEENNEGGLRAFQFVGRDAVFKGAEAELEFHLIDEDSRRLHLRLSGDYVHAQNTSDDIPLPRIPPLRCGAELAYEHGAWRYSTDVKHSVRQTRVTADEGETAGYTLLGAELSRSFPVGSAQALVYLKANNLGDVDARMHSSFLKTTAPLAGRNFRFGVRLQF